MRSLVKSLAHMIAVVHNILNPAPLLWDALRQDLANDVSQWLKLPRINQHCVHHDDVHPCPGLGHAEVGTPKLLWRHQLSSDSHHGPWFNVNHCKAPQPRSVCFPDLVNNSQSPFEVQERILETSWNPDTVALPWTILHASSYHSLSLHFKNQRVESTSCPFLPLNVWHDTDTDGNTFGLWWTVKSTRRGHTFSKPRMMQLYYFNFQLSTVCR